MEYAKLEVNSSSSPMNSDTIESDKENIKGLIDRQSFQLDALNERILYGKEKTRAAAVAILDTDKKIAVLNETLRNHQDQCSAAEVELQQVLSDSKECERHEQFLHQLKDGRRIRFHVSKTNGLTKKSNRQHQQRDNLQKNSASDERNQRIH
jgi:hypothetical protein